mgnify:CR=1 FL=1
MILDKGERLVKIESHPTWRQSRSLNHDHRNAQLARRVKLADLEDNMDIRRMIGVTPKDMERLARYRKAWAELQVPTVG